MKILTAEDAVVDRERLERVVQCLGHETLIARDGAEAWEIWESEMPQMIITAWLMPRMDGIELCRKVRAADGHRYTYIIIVTEKEGINNMVFGMDAGADDYIVKPFGREELTARIRAGEKILRAEERILKANEDLRAEIEERKKTEERLKESQAVLEKLVAERTKELNRKARSLEEINGALKVLLKAKEEYKQEVEESVISNVDHLIMPCLDMLKKSRLDTEQKTYCDILESHIIDIASPVVQKMTSQCLKLTPREIRVARLIRAHNSTKEITNILGISQSTVVFHRHNIRKKLGILNRKTNLRTYLQSF